MENILNRKCQKDGVRSVGIVGRCILGYPTWVNGSVTTPINSYVDAPERKHTRSLFAMSVIAIMGTFTVSTDILGRVRGVESRLYLPIGVHSLTSTIQSSEVTDMKDLIIELRPDTKDYIDLSKIKIDKENNAIFLSLHGFTEPADIKLAYVTCQCDDQSPEGQTQ